MLQVAVFVDAGYFFAQGSTALTGSRKERHHVALDQEGLFAALRAAALERSDGARLLRIYWYDGLPRGGPTQQQRGIAAADSVKLRLGLINELGKQKGVDSLIVTDLVDLSRNRAISDAVLLSGDEDVRIGVEIAQSLGVRVHLLGIFPSRGSQSPNLRSEADTTTEWAKGDISGFLSLTDGAPTNRAPAAGNAAAPTLAPAVESVLATVAADVVDALTDVEAATCRQTLEDSTILPHEHDGRLLAISRAHLERDLTAPERARLRQIFRKALVGGPKRKILKQQGGSVVPSIAGEDIDAAFSRHLEHYVGSLTSREVQELLGFWRTGQGVPTEHDGPLLASCRNRIGRDLTPDERRRLRTEFHARVEGRRDDK